MGIFISVICSKCRNKIALILALNELCRHIFLWAMIGDMTYISGDIKRRGSADHFGIKFGKVTGVLAVLFKLKCVQNGKY